MSKLMRLDKFLSEMNIGTRSEVKVYIKKGLVKVNDQIVRSGDLKIDAEADTVTYKNEVVGFSSVEYIMLNKPAGVVSATEDRKDKTVIDLIRDKKRKDLFPVGRLDKDTEGLLLLTNDGALAHRLLSPKKHVGKVYYAKVAGIVSEQDIAAFENGLQIDSEFRALPAKLKIISVNTELKIETSRKDNTPIMYMGMSEIEVEIYEGKFHQVKRMFEAVDKKVIYLKRLSMGSLKLDENLKTGEYRPLTEKEINILIEEHK